MPGSLLQRLVPPSDIRHATCFLAAEKSGYITEAALSGNGSPNVACGDRCAEPLPPSQRQDVADQVVRFLARQMQIRHQLMRRLQKNAQ